MKKRTDARAPLLSPADIRARLDAERDEAYRVFAASLLPGVRGLLGVRLPALRRMAAEIAHSPLAKAFLTSGAPESFEETMLRGLVTALVPCPFERRLEAVARFVPLIDNWSVCDSFCSTLGETRGHRARMFAFLAPYLQSEREFEARFGAVMLLDHFLCGEYAARSLNALAAVPARGYYARMGVAWALQTFYAAYPQETEALLTGGRVDAETVEMAVRKIAQSSKTGKDDVRRLKEKIRDR